MAKPRLIIVVRHGQSEGNKNRDIHQTIPDHRVKLTPLGWQQARDAGRRLRAMLRPTDKLHFFTSPYRRTRETADGILETLTSDTDADSPTGPSPSPFRREEIKVYEEPRLREQDFGNFQPCSAEMERMWQERADYGHFFYRIPNGESAADAYDRVSGFNESLWRQFGEDDFADVCVLVTHGLMSRVFLMKWYHFAVEYFEDLRNINHCEFLIMRKDEDTGKYTLENKLRTWSELRRERKELEDAAAGAHHTHTHNKTNGSGNSGSNNSSISNGHSPEKHADKLPRSKTFVSLRRWGGCPNGCNHGRNYKRRDDLETLRRTDEHAGIVDNDGGGSPLTIVTRRKQRVQIADPPSPTSASGVASAPSVIGIAPPHIDVTTARDASDCSSPDGTPSFISADDRLRSMRSPHLHIGRDGGGTYSGHASIDGSDDDDEESADEADPVHERVHPHSGGGCETNSHRDDGMDAKGEEEEEDGEHNASKYIDESGMGRGAKAHRLGDCSYGNSDDESVAGELDGALARLEEEEKSVRGSVY